MCWALGSIAVKLKLLFAADPNLRCSYCASDSPMLQNDKLPGGSTETSRVVEVPLQQQQLCISQRSHPGTPKEGAIFRGI